MRNLLIIGLMFLISSPCFAATRYKILSTKDMSVVSGNIGIGSTSPSGALDVGAGSICLGHSCLASWPGGSATGWTQSGSTVYTTTSTNNVGIGTNAPTSNVRVDIHGIGTTSATMSLQISNSSGTANVSFLDNGNVGIGSTAPTALLDVAGSNGWISPKGSTSDPCATAPEGTWFWNSTNHVPCWCNNASAGKRSDMTTSCF